MLFPLPGTHFPTYSSFPKPSPHLAHLSHHESPFRCHFPPLQDRGPLPGGLYSPWGPLLWHSPVLACWNHSWRWFLVWGEEGDYLFLTGSCPRPFLWEQNLRWGLGHNVCPLSICWRNGWMGVNFALSVWIGFLKYSSLPLDGHCLLCLVCSYLARHHGG